MSEQPKNPVVLPAPPAGDFPDATGKGAERRVAPRFPFTAAAEVMDLRTEARVTGRCSDLGPGGCYIDTLAPFAVGSAVQVRLERELHEFESEAVVAYAHTAMGMGLAFTKIESKHQATLRSWIAELSGEEPSQIRVASGVETGILAALESQRKVLSELINLMLRRKAITENEAAGLLRQILR